jgi:hypothetical protein
MTGRAGAAREFADDREVSVSVSSGDRFSGGSGGSPAQGNAAGRRGLAILLAVIGVLALVLAAIFFFDAAALPTFVQGRSHHGHHLIRVLISLAIAIAFLIGALVAARSKPAAPAPARNAGGADPAAQADPAWGSTPTISSEPGAGQAPDVGQPPGAEQWPEQRTAPWQGKAAETWQDPGSGPGAAGPTRPA